LKFVLEEENMTAREVVRWGVISTANIGREVIPAIQSSSNGMLAAVASREIDKARQFAAELNIPRAYGSYEELLADEDIDAVYNPLPNNLHMEWSVRAAEAGKHILCEKPLALNEHECREMEAAAQVYSVKLMEAFMYRFHPRTQRVIELCQSGALGKLRVIRSAFTFNLDRPDDIRWQSDLGGGALMDVGCYCVNISRTASGSTPVEAQAFARWTPGGVDEQLAGTIRFANGVIAQFDCAFTVERRDYVALASTQAWLELEDAFGPGNEVTHIRMVKDRQNETDELIPGTDQYRHMVEHFADCVLHDHPLMYPPAEAADNMRVIDALYRSARKGGIPESLV
jgi:xylose dehydrogenase (NAD/NADP)